MLKWHLIMASTQGEYVPANNCTHVLFIVQFLKQNQMKHMKVTSYKVDGIKVKSSLC